MNRREFIAASVASAALMQQRMTALAETSGSLNVSIDGVDAADMLLDIPSVVLSTGSACGNGEPSHVLAAMGHTEYAMHGSIRFGIGRTNTGEEIDMAIDLLTDATARWRRANAPLSAA